MSFQGPIRSTSKCTGYFIIIIIIFICESQASLKVLADDLNARAERENDTKATLEALVSVVVFQAGDGRNVCLILFILNHDRE